MNIYNKQTDIEFNTTANYLQIDSNKSALGFVRIDSEFRVPTE